MKALVVDLLGPKRVELNEYPLDEHLATDEVLAKTEYSVISPGTEIAAYIGLPPLRPGPIYPRVVGYCNVARVVAVGTDVSQYSVGDRILTFQSHRSHFKTSADKVILKLPESVSSKAAATTYLFHLGYHALLTADFTPGHSVAVIGLGTLGLTSVAMTHCAGGIPYAFSNQFVARELALEFGASVASAKGESTGNIEDVDIVVVTTNDWKDWQLALRTVRRGGTVVVLGFPGRDEPIPPFNPLASEYFYDKQLTLKACGLAPDLEIAAHDIRFTVKRNMQYLLECIIKQKLPALNLITKEYDADQIEDAYQCLLSHEPGMITCGLNWENMDA